jgi:hypothetical protein
LPVSLVSPRPNKYSRKFAKGYPGQFSNYLVLGYNTRSVPKISDWITVTDGNSLQRSTIFSQLCSNLARAQTKWLPCDDIIVWLFENCVVNVVRSVSRSGCVCVIVRLYVI